MRTDQKNYDRDGRIEIVADGDLGYRVVISPLQGECPVIAGGFDSMSDATKFAVRLAKHLDRRGD